MSALTEQVQDALARGATVDAVARRLGMPTSLVQVVVDGLAGRGGARVRTCGPSGCPTSRAAAPPSCAGCPLVPLGRPRR